MCENVSVHVCAQTFMERNTLFVRLLNCDLIHRKKGIIFRQMFDSFSGSSYHSVTIVKEVGVLCTYITQTSNHSEN